MKNITLFFMLLVSVTIYSQESYPHMRPQLMVNKTVRIIPQEKGTLHERCGYEDFYEDPKCYTIYKECDTSRSLHDALSNREFKVTAMNEGKGYQSRLYIYTLEDTATKEVIYYEYNPKYKDLYEYPFEVIGGLDLPADFYCDYIESYSKENYSKHEVKSQAVFELDKVTIDNDAVYTLKFIGSSKDFKGKGYTIELEDGQVIRDAAFPVQKYGTTATGRYFWHKLSKKDIEMLSKSRVKKVTMGNTLQKNINPHDGMLLQGTLPCIVSKQ